MIAFPVSRTGLLSLLLLAATAGLAPGEWNPPPPAADEFDWIQLSSGEWLKGELKSYVDDEITFDSDKLGLQQLESEDVKFIRTAEPVRVGYQKPGDNPGLGRLRRDNIQVAEGRVEVKDGKVRTRDGGREIAAVEDVVTIASGSKSEWDNWLARISLGANFREGNTRQVEYDAAVELARVTPHNRFRFNYLGTYSESDGTEFSNNHRADFSYDLYRTPQLFFRPVFGEYFRDPFQNIAHRTMLGMGVGYEIIHSSKTDWEVVAGPAWQSIRYDSVLAGESNREESAAAVVATRFEKEINDRVDFLSLYRFGITRSSAGGYSHHFANTFSFELTDDLDFDISLIWDRINDPATDSAGNDPKQDDLRLMFLLGYEL